MNKNERKHVIEEANRLLESDAMKTTQSTTWADSMILASVRDGAMLTPAAFQRCFDLAEQGLIDMTGTWRLTPQGEEASRD